jgi:hypothetical protein
MMKIYYLQFVDGEVALAVLAAAPRAADAARLPITST